MKTTLLSLFSLFLLFSVVNGGTADKYSRIRILVPDRAALNQVWSSGIDYEGSSGKIGGWMEFVAGTAELKSLAVKGISYQVVVSDLTAAYQKQLSPAPANALGFGYGSMGGFYTYDEVVQQLDSMQLLYPSLISAKRSIGVTSQGRVLWAVMISNDPNSVNPAKPEVLYTALHHAREPEGMMSVIYYMWWLLENYGTNPEAAYLVNNRQMWFIPVVNPDGYVYNQTNVPTGGGMWRKNRRNNGDGTYGVDLNRNYGTYEMWNAPNGGSSESTGNETYRGTAPFSELETAAIDRFMWAHNIKTAFNYHTYGNYLIYPWGYLSRESGDSLVYRDWTYDMSAANHFTNGTDQQTVNYSTRGGSDDYMFGDTSKPITYAMTPEVGATGFWPSTPEIFPLAIANLPQNKILAYVAGQYSCVVGYEVQDSGNGNGFLDRAEAFSLRLSVLNRGLGAASNLSVAATSSSADVQLVSPAAISSLASRAADTVVLHGSVAAQAALGVPFKIYIAISDPLGYQKLDTLNLFLGTPRTVFADSASNGIANWSTGQGWGVTANAHSAPGAFTDSPFGDYAPDADNSLTTINPFAFTGCQYAELRFFTKWAAEPTWDFATVEISTNNGSSWASLRSKLSHSGSNRGGSKQPAAAWGYESFTPGLTWTEQQIDLSSYIGQQVKLRFRLNADNAEQRDGFYVDDIRVFGYTTISDTLPPAAPALALPAGGASGLPHNVSFSWHPSTAAGQYRLQIALDSTFSNLFFDDAALADTSKLVGSLPYNTLYFWRVAALNVNGQGPFSEIRSFATLLTVPSPPDLYSPANGAISRPVALDVIWNASPGAASYRVQVAYDSLFASMVIDDSSATGASLHIAPLLDDTTYYWRVSAKNILGISDWSSPVFHFSTGTVSVSISVAPRWNLLSLPLHVADPRKNALFPTAVNSAFAYDPFSGYQPKDTLPEDAGIWMKFDSSHSIIIIGNPRDLDTVEVKIGWNMIGSLTAPVAVAAIQSTPPGMVTSAFFDYQGSYIPRDTLEPGFGYWVKVNQSGSLLLSSQGSSSITKSVEASRIRISRTGELPPLPPEDMPSSVSAKLPREYALIDAYPNPFNPSATIIYHLPVTSRVSLKVYNTLGQAVAVLVDASGQGPGVRQVVWNAANVSSGIYFYRLEAASETDPGRSFSGVKQMILLK